MKNIKLLDCTLRDGGYLNDWEFSHDTLISIFERLVNTNVDVIEVGFLDDRRAFDINRTIMPNTECVNKIFGEIDKKNAMIVGMIDYGTCAIENIQPCDECYLDGIRVIFKKHVMYEAIAFCKQIKALGYKVFAQMVSITSYNNDELLEFVDLVNEAKPYAVSMVDTYGLLHQENLSNVFEILNANLDSDICLGYHAHNNFQMAYANCIKIINKEVNRALLVDGTLYGMGKSAGNAPLELLATYMNDNLGTNYNINQMLEAIENDIFEIQKKLQWGYNLFYFISAANYCHPNYVSFLMNKGTLSIKSINEILKGLQGEKKLLYDQKYIEQLYLDFQKNKISVEDTRKELADVLCNKSVLILGPGKSIDDNHDQIEEFIQSENPVVISINFLHEKYLKPEYLFLTNSKRYGQMATKLSSSANNNLKIISTSNVTKSNGNFAYKIDYSTLIDENSIIPDNSFVMLVKLLMQFDIKDLNFAGLDGYVADNMNYYKTNMEYDFAKDKAEYLNNYVKEFLKSISPKISFKFLTDSLYES